MLSKILIHLKTSFLHTAVVYSSEIKNCIDEYAWAICDFQAYLIKSYDDCQEFYNWCNETIDKYNR